MGIAKLQDSLCRRRRAARTDVDVREPDEVGGVGVEEDVVFARLVVAEQVLHLQPRVAPVEPQRRFQRDQLENVTRA